MASYIKQNKDVTLQGTKRFTDKSGEYYLKNVQLQNSQRDPHSHKKMSLNNPQNLENCLNRNIDRIKRKASRIVTLLPENSLTPIPKKDGRNTGMADRYGKKELKDAERTAVFIRRMEYATSMKRQMDEDKNLKNQAKKIALIQEWWKTMYKIIKLQKNMRGFLFRKKLMNNLEHQEKLLQFITEFDNIHSYHLYKQFMDNLKKKRDYENSKLMEKCEDFNEKLDNLEKLHNLKNFKNCFNKWKNDTKQKKKEDLDNLANKLNDILSNKINQNKKDVLDKIKKKANGEDEVLNDKIKDFQTKHGRDKALKDIIKAHRLNKILNDIKNKLDDKNKRDAFEQLKQKNNIERAGDKLKKIIDNNLKRQAWNDLKTMDFVDKLDDLINKHNDKVEKDAKKELLDKLKDISNKNKLKDKLKDWKDFNDEMKNRMKILNKLKRHKSNELKKKAEQEKNKICISSGINDIEILSDKKPDSDGPRNSQVFMSPQNDINFLAKPTPKLELSGQNFSLIPSVLNKFQFFESPKRTRKINIKTIRNQLEDVKSFKNNKVKKNNLDNLANKLNDILTKAKKESDDQLKKDVLDKLKKNNDIAKAIQKLDDLLKNNPKKDFLDKLKRIRNIAKAGEGVNKGLNILDKLFNNKLKKDALDKLRKKAYAQMALEDLDKLLGDKYKNKFMDNFRKKNDQAKGIDLLKKYIQTNARKIFLDKFVKNDDFQKGMQALAKLIRNKNKQDTLDEFKKNDKVVIGTNNLEKLITNKLRKKFLDRIKNNKKNAYNKLDKLLNNKLKKNAFDTLKKNYYLTKAVQMADKILKDKKDKIKKDILDNLMKRDVIAKATNKLDKILNNKLKQKGFDKLKKYDDFSKILQKLDKLISNKLKDDTLYKLKTMDFVDILDKMKKKHDDNDKKEKLEKLMNNLKEIKNKSKEEEKNKLKKAFDHWRTIKELRDLLDLFKKKKYLDNWRGKCETKEIFHSFQTLKKKIYLHKLKDKVDRMKIKDKLVDKAKMKKALDHWRTIKELRDLLDLLKKMKYFDKWLDKCEIKEILSSFKVMRNIKKKKILLKRIQDMDEQKNNYNLKKYFDKWKEIAFKPTYKSKRISRRRSPKKSRVKNKNKKPIEKRIEKYNNKIDKINDLKLLRKAFNKWRQISSFAETRDVLEHIKKNRLLNDNLENLSEEQKNNLLHKYKNKVLRVLLNIYARQRQSILKEYIYRWKKALGTKQIKNEIKEYSKYKKKPKILDTRNDNEEYDKIEPKKESFRPTYIVSSKKNIYGQGRIYNANSKDGFNEKYTQTENNLNSNPSQNIESQSNSKAQKQNLPYKKKYGKKGSDYDLSSNNPEDFRKKYGQKLFENEPLSNPEDFNSNNYNYDLLPNIPKDKEIHVNGSQNINLNINLDDKNPKDNYNIKEIDQQLYSDSSINDSLLSGMTLVQNHKETKQPRNYTSQSFFIDKNIINNLAKNNNNYHLNSHNPNQLPMTMKGDFVSLIEQNPKILAQKNPRIQVTNATCDLNEIINNENTDEDELNTDEVNSEIDKLKNNYVIDKNKILTKVIHNCDKDVYSSQKPFISKKDQWYSVSIPLNDNEAKWEFLNNIKGERDKNNLNKFELIQNELDTNKIEEKEEPYNTKSFKSIRTERKKNPSRGKKDSSYKLREMNFAQFYRSPNRSRKVSKNYGDKTPSGGSSIRRPGQKRKMQGSQSYLCITYNGKKNKNNGSNNIDRSKGKIQLDPKYKSIDYDDKDEYNNYSEE